MARGNKKGSHQGHNHRPTASLPPATASVETVTDKRQNLRITWSLIGAGASFFIAIASAVFTWLAVREAAQANKLTRQAQDRASGKVRAKFEFVDEKNKDPSLVKPFIRKQDGYDKQVFRIENVDELVKWGPYVLVRNTGNEPIDAIKIDVSYFIGAAYGVGVHQIEPTPVVYSEDSSYEATTFGKVMPGQTVRLGVGPLLLQQLTNLGWQDFAEKDHAGMFAVSVSCRLVGMASYDQMDKSQRLSFYFHWRPAGFKPDAKNVKEYLAKKPNIEVK